MMLGNHKKLLLVISVLLCCSFALGAINPKKHLRVTPIRIGRVIFVEEPASTLFSFLIAVMCGITLFQYYQNHRKLRSQFVNYPYHWIWYGFLILFTLSFTWSTLFHMHETFLFERLDYMFAIISWGYQVFSACIVVFNVTSKKKITLIAIPFLLRIGYFVYFMLFVRFRYDYAIFVVTQFVVLHAVLWLPWALWQVKQGRKYGYYVILSHILTGIFVLFEINDFIPIWRVFDGHSLWHLGHLLMIYSWIRFCKLHLEYHSSRQFLE